MINQSLTHMLSSSVRDKLSLWSPQVSDELSRLRQQTRGPASSAAVFRRLEAQRDDAQLELRQLRAECQSLRDRLKTAQDGQQHDLVTMEDRIAELQLQLDEVGVGSN